MLRNAPKFMKLLRELLKLQSCILVAHNAEFDYRILSLEFKELF